MIENISIKKISCGVIVFLFVFLVSTCSFSHDNSSEAPSNSEITHLMYGSMNDTSRSNYDAIVKRKEDRQLGMYLPMLREAKHRICKEEKSGWYFCTYDEYKHYVKDELDEKYGVSHDVRMIHVIKLGSYIYSFSASSPTEIK